MSQFPNKDNVVLILCDDFRNEGDGKISIFGVFSDSIYVVSTNESGIAALPSLGIYVIFRDGLGEFKATIDVRDPDGKSLLPPNAESQSVTKKSDEWMNFAIKFQPFSGPLGEYKLTLSLTDKDGVTQEYAQPFHVRQKKLH